MFSKIHTSCKKCIFAKWDGKTQDGCWLNRIQLFKQHNAEIIEVYDDEKEFLAISAKHCICKRTDKWLDKYQWDASDPPSFQDHKKKLYEELQIKYKAIIIAGSTEDTELTLNSILNQDIRPQTLTLIRLIDSALPPSYLTSLCSNIGMPWRVENSMNTDMTWERVVDLANNHKPQPYYGVFFAGCNVPSNTFSTLNDKIINELLQLTVIKPNSQNDGLIVNYYIHKLYGGNKDSSLVKKLEKENKILKGINDICPNFPR